MLNPVPGNERHLPALDGSNRDGGRRFSVGGVDVHLPYIVEERIEARPPEDPDPDGLASLPAQAVFSFVLELGALLDSSDFDFSDFPDFAAAGVEASPAGDSALSPPLFEVAPAFDLESVE